MNISKSIAIAIRTLEFNIAMLNGGIDYLEKEGLSKRAKKLKTHRDELQLELRQLKGQQISSLIPAVKYESN